MFMSHYATEVCKCPEMFGVIWFSSILRETENQLFLDVGRGTSSSDLLDEASGDLLLMQACENTDHFRSKKVFGEVYEVIRAVLTNFGLFNIAKIKTVPHTLVKLADGEFGYLTKRVDRTADGKPLSMLDMCQLSNRLTEHKYDGTYVQLADVVLKYSVVPLLDVQRFWEIVIFSWITGNSDMHCKNFSLIDEKGIGAYRLAPAYDLLSVLLADKNDTDEMAMTFEVGGRKSGFGRETFIKAMTESGVGEKVAAKIISRLCACESAWCEAIDSSFLSDNLKREYKILIHSRLVQLI